MQFTRGYDKWLAYAQSKPPTRFSPFSSTSSAHAMAYAPFLCNRENSTPLARHITHAEMVAADWIDEQGTLLDPTFKTPEQGAATVGGDVAPHPKARMPSSRNTLLTVEQTTERGSPPPMSAWPRPANEFLSG